MDEKVTVPRPSPRLEELIRKRFPAEGRAERIARALAAVNEDELIHLTPEQWKWVAEDSDLEQQG
jgi:uncharacterized membrane protein